MNLVIDQGNSSVKVAVFRGDEMIYVEKFQHFSIEEYKSLKNRYDICRAIRSSVTGTDLKLANYIEKESIKWIELSSKTPIPIEILYKTPSTLGMDRVAVCVGANYLRPDNNMLIIDVGTAITYDLVNSKNQYVGGNISLGIEMRRQALHAYTAKLPLVEVPDDVPLVGTTTEEAISSGIVNGILGEMESYIAEFSKIYPNLLVFLTGGSLKCFERRIKNRIFAIPNLVQIGLNRILNFR